MFFLHSRLLFVAPLKSLDSHLPTSTRTKNLPVLGGMRILCQANGCNEEQDPAPAPPTEFSVAANGMVTPPIVELPAGISQFTLEVFVSGAPETTVTLERISTVYCAPGAEPQSGVPYAVAPPPYPPTGPSFNYRCTYNYVGAAASGIAWAAARVRVRYRARPRYKHYTVVQTVVVHYN